MTVETSLLPVLACLASLLAIPAIIAFGRRPNLREGVTFAAGAIKLGLVLMMLPGVLNGTIYEFRFLELVAGVGLEFRVDGLGLLFGIVAAFLWICTSLYAVGYMRAHHEPNQTRFYAFFALSLCATLGVAFSGNLLTLYIFYEMLSLSTFPLVTHNGDKAARTGGRTYLTYLLGTSVAFVLPALVYCYVKAGGDLRFAAEGFLRGKVEGGEALILLLALVFGFAKSGMMPFHSWLPNAMVAPTPVSALLHAVAVVKVGVFCVIRVVTGVFGTAFLAELNWALIISWAAAATILISSLIALTQDNLKRRLAFSTIGQLAYIILGVSLLTDGAVVGSIMHIATHAVGKITLFFCAGAIYVASHKKYVSQLDGLGRRMPWTFAAFLLASLSIIGLPPFFGSWSKWFLFVGTMEADQWAFAVVLIASTLLNIAYLLPIPLRAFTKPLPPGDHGQDHDHHGAHDSHEIHGEAPLACVIPLCVTAGLCFVLFLMPGLFHRLAELMLVVTP